MLRIAIAGASGRMGKMLIEAVNNAADMTLAGALDIATSPAIGSDATAFLGKSSGVAVTAGVTPAHFMLSDLALADFRTFARLSPPLREEADRHAVLEALSDGTIDVVASGHDPRGPEDKRLPFADAAPGMAGAETLLAMVLTLVRDGAIATERAFDLVARNPARLLGIEAGKLRLGAEADIALIDPEKPWVVDSARMAASAGNTPFDRQPVQGRVTALWKGGVTVE